MSQFAKQLKKYGSLVEKQAIKEVRGIALQGLTGVTEKSPVDEGTFKGNWNVGINTVDDSTNPEFKDDPVPRGRAKINEYDTGDTINISNNMPYADRLENGYSPQSEGMIRRTEAELKSLIRRRNKKI